MPSVDAKLQKTLEKASNLIKLANDDPDSEESRNAAIQVTKLMKEHELVIIPRSEIERVKTMVEGAQALARQQGDQKMHNMMMGGVIGLLLSKQFKF